jgi:rRNA pseudouridine-1189 N-methylase Emg1 (Nep1/Mra1 family)
MMDLVAIPRKDLSIFPKCRGRAHVLGEAVPRNKDDDNAMVLSIKEKAEEKRSKLRNRPDLIIVCLELRLTSSRSLWLVVGIYKHWHNIIFWIYDDVYDDVVWVCRLYWTRD